ncbi:hypothetical protein MMC19_005311 [Ptychographa xylographoides]|nr:hypothetical protein [Ptychographa xylographoides]
MHRLRNGSLVEKFQQKVEANERERRAELTAQKIKEEQLRGLGIDDYHKYTWRAHSENLSTDEMGNFQNSTGSTKGIFELEASCESDYVEPPPIRPTIQPALPPSPELSESASIVVAETPHNSSGSGSYRITIRKLQVDLDAKVEKIRELEQIILKANSHIKQLQSQRDELELQRLTQLWSINHFDDHVTKLEARHSILSKQLITAREERTALESELDKERLKQSDLRRELEAARSQRPSAREADEASTRAPGVQIETPRGRAKRGKTLRRTSTGRSGQVTITNYEVEKVKGCLVM